MWQAGQDFTCPNLLETTTMSIPAYLVRNSSSGHRITARVPAIEDLGIVRAPTRARAREMAREKTDESFTLTALDTTGMREGEWITWYATDGPLLREKS